MGSTDPGLEETSSNWGPDTHTSPSLRHGGSPWEGTRCHVSTDEQDTRRLVFLLPGAQGHVSPALQVPRQQPLLPLPQGREPFTHSSLWERACPCGLHSAPHSLRSTTLSWLLPTKELLLSPLPACLSCLSVSAGPKAKGKESPKYTNPGSNPPGLPTSVVFQLNHLDGWHVTHVSTNHGNTQFRVSS